MDNAADSDDEDIGDGKWQWIFKVTRCSRSCVSQFVSQWIHVDLTDVTLASEDTDDHDIFVKSFTEAYFLKLRNLPEEDA